MDIDVLKEFITLSQKLNFNETAKLHFLTQPVLSRHIQQLEAELNVTLFHRTRQAVTLTRYGTIFLEDAKLMVATYESAMKKLELATEKFDSTLSLAFLDAASRDLLPNILSTFIKQHPSIALEFVNSNIPKTLQLLESRECDMAITLKPLSGSYPDYDYIDLYRDPLCLTVPSSHKLADKKSITFQEIKGETYLAASPDIVSDYQMFLEYISRKNGFTFSIKKEVDSVEKGFMMVEAGYGISIVPKHQKYFASPSIKMIPIDDDECFVDVVLTWRKDNPNPNIPKMVSLVKDILD